MADIGQLGNLKSAEPLDLDIYTPTKEGPSRPKAGRYTVRAPETFPAEAFGKTKTEFLSARVDPTIIGPTSEGYTLKFTTVSATPFKNNPKISQLGLYLLATGVKDKVAADPQAQADAVERTAGAVYEVYVDWRARNNATGFEVKGMTNFPKNEAGEYQPWVEDPNDVDEQGNPKRVWANAVVTKFVTPS